MDELKKMDPPAKKKATKPKEVVVVEGGEPAVVVTPMEEPKPVRKTEAEVFFKEPIFGYSKVQARYLAVGHLVVHMDTKTVWEVVSKFQGSITIRKANAHHIRREIAFLPFEKQYKEPVFA